MIIKILNWHYPLQKSVRNILASRCAHLRFLSEDRKHLEEQLALQPLVPLRHAIDEVSKDLDGFAADLRRSGFGVAASGSARKLRESFVSAVKAVKNGPNAELPWLAIRTLGLKLNNELSDFDSAHNLAKGLFELASELGVKDEILTRARQDSRAIERNKLERALTADVQANRYSAALVIVEDLLSDYQSPEERDMLRGLKDRLQSKKRNRYIGWGIAATIALAIVANAVNDKPTYRPAPQPSPSPSPTYPPPPSPRFGQLRGSSASTRSRFSPQRRKLTLLYVSRR